MKKYLKLFSLAWSGQLEYRFNLLFHTLRYMVLVLMFTFLWQAVGRETSLALSSQQLTFYYLLASIFYGFSNFHTDQVETDIRTGHISIYLVRPVSAFGVYFTQYFAEILIEGIIKTFIVIGIIFLFHLETQIEPIKLILAACFLFLTFFSQFTLYLTASLCAFWLQAVDSVRMCIMFAFRFLSGVFIPLMFLPLWYQNISKLLPFQHTAFTPIQLIRNQLSIEEGLFSLGVLIAWSSVFFIIHIFVWRRAVHSYESTGI